MKNDIMKHIIKENKLSFIGIGVLLLITSALSIGISMVLMKIIDDILPQFNFRKLIVTIIAYIVLCIVQVVFSFICNYVNSIFLMKTELNLRKVIADKILCKSGKFFVSSNSGELYQVVVGDTAQVCDFIIDNVFSIMYILFSFLTSTIYLAILDWKLFIIIMFLQPISIVMQIIISPVITRNSQKQRDIIGEYILSVQEVFMNPIQLILSGLKDKLVIRMNEKMMENYHISKKMLIIDGLSSHLAELLRSITICAVIGYGGYSIMNGNMSIGVLVVFITYSQKLISNFESLWDFSIDFSEIKPIYERVNSYFSENIPIQDGVMMEKETPDIEFDNVNFSYDKRKNIYNGLSYTFKYGNKYGLVGKTGEGKSSFVKLLYDMWSLDGGKIKLGGSDCREISKESINEILIYISPDALIINDSIYNNVVLGKENVTIDEVYGALKKVCFYDEVVNMKYGLDTVVGDEGNILSSGQKQRLVLARAMISGKKITILDEPTSALDVATQNLVMQEIYSEFSDRTLIIITHDSSILACCDEVLCLKNGIFEKQKNSNKI